MKYTTVVALLAVIIPVVATLLFGWMGFLLQLIPAFFVYRKSRATVYADSKGFGLLYGGFHIIALALGQVAGITTLVVSWFI